MALIRFLPDDVSVDVATGTTVLEAALQASVPHTHACGGNARCTTCRILVIDGQRSLADPSWKETRIARKLGLGGDFRLACQTRVEGDATVRRLVIDPEDVALTVRADGLVPIGVEKRIAVMFSDIRNFTPLAESLLPYDVIHLLNRHFYEMGQIIERHGGRITTYMGDGLMALFGLDQGDDTDGVLASMAAVRAGAQMIERQNERRDDLVALYGASYQIGIGVHTGQAVVGELGGQASATTAIGDVVNMASRIEGATKQVGVSLLVSEVTFKDVERFVEVGKRVRLELKGKLGTHPLYEIARVR